MFLTKLAVYGTIAGTFFAVSAFSTVQITKQLNKTPVPNEVGEEEDDDYVRQMSDTEHFINSLTGFGNMEGNLNAVIKNDNYTVTIKGDVFVSMETMEDIQIDANITINALDRDFNIKATYIDNTLYTTIERNRLKLSTSSISEISSLFAMESPVELPDVFKNIDTNQLISNLSAMTSEKSDDHITYTCNLIEGIPPIIFTSDLDYNMTRVTLTDFNFEDFNINVSAKTTILGKGHNRVKCPETITKRYADVSSYFNTIKQINSLLDTKETNLAYKVDLLKDNAKYISTSGEASISLKNGLSLGVNGTLYNKNSTKTAKYFVSYQDDSVYVKYNDTLKINYDTNNFNAVKTSIESILDNPTFTTLFSKSSTISIPVVDLVKAKNYQGLMDKYSNIIITDNQIKLYLSNSLLGNDTSDFDITIDIDNNGIKDLKIDNLRYNEYTLSLSLEIKNYNSISLTKSEANTYTKLQYIDNIFDKVNELVQEREFTINLTGKANLGKGDLNINGTSYVSLNNEDGNSKYDIGLAELNITDTKNKTHNIKLDVNRIKPNENATEQEKKVARENSKVLFNYNNKLKGNLNINSLVETYKMLGDLEEKGNPLLQKISALFIDENNQSAIARILKGDIEAIVFDNSLKSITYNEANHSYDITFGGELFKENSNDEVGDIHIYINLDNNNKLTGIGIKGNLGKYSLDIDAYVSKANGNTMSWNRLEYNSKTYYDFSEIKTLAEYLFNTATNKSFRLEGTADVSLMIGSIKIIADINITDKGETIAKVQFNDIPYALVTSWSRSSTIYVVEKKVGEDMTRDIFIETTYKDHIWSSATTDRVKLTTEEFTKNIAYYLGNFTIGLSTDLSSASSTGDKDIDYASVLKSFTFSESNNIPTWTITLDVGELASTNALDDAIITVDGTSTTGSRYLSHIHAELGIIKILSATIDASVKSLNYSAVQSGCNDAINYANNHRNDSYNYR